MKVVHIPFTVGLYIPFANHMWNLIKTEEMFGISSQYLPPEQCSADGLPDCDLIHIHGFPPLDRSVRILNIIKEAILENKPIVISAYNYSPLCYDCTLIDCGEKCEKTKQLTKFMKKIPLFVFSNAASKIFGQNEFKTYRMPICHYSDDPRFIAPQRDEDISKRIGVYNFADCFSRERELVEKIKKQASDFRWYDIEYFSNYDVDLTFFPCCWQNSFPYEIGASLSKGIQVVTNSLQLSEEFDSGVIYASEEELVDKMSLSKSPPEARVVAYKFWEKHGMEVCLGYYYSIYDIIIKGKWNETVYSGQNSPFSLSIAK